VSGISSLTKEQYLCPTDVDYVQPLRALNSDGEWRLIVNQVTIRQNFTSTTMHVTTCNLDTVVDCC
jgi:hypothetical protein